MAHLGQHEDCFGCKLRSIQMNGGPSSNTLMERRWSRDMPAYYRLRQQGLQPPHIDGSAVLESQASSQVEVEMGKLFSKRGLKTAIEGMEGAKEVREQMQEKGESLLRKRT